MMAKSGESPLSVFLDFLDASLFVLLLLGPGDIVENCASLQLPSLSEQLAASSIVLDQHMQQFLGLSWFAGELELFGNLGTIFFEKLMELILIEQLLGVDEPGHEGVPRAFLKGHFGCFEVTLDLCEHFQLLKHFVLNSDELLVDVVVVIFSFLRLLAHLSLFGLTLVAIIMGHEGHEAVSFNHLGCGGRGSFLLAAAVFRLNEEEWSKVMLMRF